MRSVENFSREEDLMTVSVPPSSSASQEGNQRAALAKALGADRELITSVQTPERSMEVLEGTEKHKLCPSSEAGSSDAAGICSSVSVIRLLTGTRLMGLPKNSSSTCNVKYLQVKFSSKYSTKHKHMFLN